MKKEPLAESRTGQWTRPEDYVTALARKRTARKGREPRRSSEPEVPRFSLSTLPFVALLAALALLAIAIMVVAFPGAQPQSRTDRVAAREQGVAQKGWFQEAQKEFHH
jgi:hypothetical protein